MNMNLPTIDFTLLASAELSKHPKIYTEIDSVYYKNKALYDLRAKENPNYQSPYLNNRPLESDGYAKKVFGILQSMLSDADMEILNTVWGWCKKTHPEILTYVERQKDKISFSHFIAEFPSVMKNAEANTAFDVFGILFLLCMTKEKEIACDGNTPSLVYTMYNCIESYNQPDLELEDKLEKKYLKLKERMKFLCANIDQLAALKPEYDLDYLLSFYYGSCQNILALDQIKTPILTEQETNRILRYYTLLFIRDKSIEKLDERAFCERLTVVSMLINYAKAYQQAKAFANEKKDELQQAEAKIKQLEAKIKELEKK